MEGHRPRALTILAELASVCALALACYAAYRNYSSDAAKANSKREIDGGGGVESSNDNATIAARREAEARLRAAIDKQRRLDERRRARNRDRGHLTSACDAFRRGERVDVDERTFQMEDCVDLGELYEDGADGGVKDAVKAAELYQAACDGGYSWGCHRGQMLAVRKRLDEMEARARGR